AAYDGAKTAQVPDDLAAALAASPAAAAFFETLDKRNRYAILYRIQDVQKAETRARRIEKYVAMLARGEKLHPYPPPTQVPRKRRSRSAWAGVTPTTTATLGAPPGRLCGTGEGCRTGAARPRRRRDFTPTAIRRAGTGIPSPLFRDDGD